MIVLQLNIFQKKLEKSLEIKILKQIFVDTNIWYDSIMCGYFVIGFINSMFQRKRLLEYANLFSPNEYEKNDEIILRYFQ